MSRFEIDCPDCGEPYKSLGAHISQSNCEYPIVTNRQHQIITGCIMGDGSVQRGGANPAVVVSNFKKDFLDYIYQELKPHALPPFDSLVRTMSSPRFGRYASWYRNGVKTFPEDTKLTELVAKMWYACDGSMNYSKRSTNGSIILGVSNEIHRGDWLVSLFEDIGIYPVKGSGVLHFNVEETKKFIDYIGQEVPGYQYKWVHDSKDNYKVLKNGMD